jgi:hypothetical protein
MPRTETLLRLVLAVTGLGCLLAVFPAVMPLSWMAATHRWLGLGPMPQGPVVEYLARSLCAFYAFLGALLVLLATDVRRYARIITFTAIAAALFSVFIFVVDLAGGLPLWWTLGESLATLAVAIAVLVLQHRLRRGESGAPES